MFEGYFDVVIKYLSFTKNNNYYLTVISELKGDVAFIREVVLKSSSGDTCVSTDLILECLYSKIHGNIQIYKNGL